MSLGHGRYPVPEQDFLIHLPDKHLLSRDLVHNVNIRPFALRDEALLVDLKRKRWVEAQELVVIGHDHLQPFCLTGKHRLIVIRRLDFVVSYTVRLLSLLH